MSEKPDCKTCGACCWSPVDQEAWCDLTDKEAKAFSPQFRARNVVIYSFFHMIAEGSPDAALRTKWASVKSGPFKGDEVCVCCQLEGSLMHRVKCRIYDKRPHTCRASVRPGDKNCLEIRERIREVLV
jgi:Fe-S-cluster containining protein